MSMVTEKYFLKFLFILPTQRVEYYLISFYYLGKNCTNTQDDSESTCVPDNLIPLSLLSISGGGRFLLFQECKFRSYEK